MWTTINDVWATQNTVVLPGVKIYLEQTKMSQQFAKVSDNLRAPWPLDSSPLTITANIRRTRIYNNSMQRIHYNSFYERKSVETPSTWKICKKLTTCCIYRRILLSLIMKIEIYQSCQVAKKEVLKIIKFVCYRWTSRTIIKSIKNNYLDRRTYQQHHKAKKKYHKDKWKGLPLWSTTKLSPETR